MTIHPAASLLGVVLFAASPLSYAQAEGQPFVPAITHDLTHPGQAPVLDALWADKLAAKRSQGRHARTHDMTIPHGDGLIVVSIFDALPECDNGPNSRTATPTPQFCPMRVAWVVAGKIVSTKQLQNGCLTTALTDANGKLPPNTNTRARFEPSDSMLTVQAWYGGKPVSKTYFNQSCAVRARLDLRQ